MFLYEKNTLKLYYYKTLLRIDPCEIVVLYAQYFLHIVGNGLCVSFFEREELHITGNIQYIRMEKKDGEK